jgi:hypothetical protein
MKIIFICGSLEPGSDGVGDYTRRLAGELRQSGYQTQIIALNDKYTSVNIDHFQNYKKTEIPVLRLPASAGWRERSIYLKKWIDVFEPDYISLQYVPYAFQKRGLPINLSRCLKNVGNGGKWHIMFHEIWIGEPVGSSKKDKIVGFLQKNIAVYLVRLIQPKWISTSNEFYQKCLKKEGINAIKIQIFNSLLNGEGVKGILNKCFPLKIQQNRKEYIIASFFGGVLLSNDLCSKVIQLSCEVNKIGKILLVTHVGRCDGIDQFFTEMSTKTGIQTIVLGEWPEYDVSDYLSEIDLGISTHPKILYEKSSSIATMLNNGLPVILLRDSFEKDDRIIAEIKELNEIKQLNTFLLQDKSFKSTYGIERAKNVYIEAFD